MRWRSWGGTEIREDTHSALGQKFRRAMKNNPDWARCKTKDDRGKIRMDWLRGKYDEVVSKRKRTRYEDHRTTEDGTFEPLDIIIEKEGAAQQREH